MKSHKKFIAIAALGALSLSYGSVASAADLTAWRTAALGEDIGNSFVVDQMFAGRATTQTICGATPVPCNVMVKLDKSAIDVQTKIGTFSGVVAVVAGDSLVPIPSILPSKIVTSYKISGSLNINTFSAAGTFDQGSNKKDYSATFTGAPMFILAPNGTVAYGGGVLEVNLTLNQ